MQLCKTIEMGERLVLQQTFQRLRAIGDGEAADAGIASHLQVIGRVANHERTFRYRSQFIHDFMQHLRMGFREAFVSASAGEKMRMQLGSRHCPIQPAPRLAGRDGKHEALISQLRYGFGYALDYLGDNNGDGVEDLVIGAPGAAVDGIYNAGKIYILSIMAD